MATTDIFMTVKLGKLDLTSTRDLHLTSTQATQFTGTLIVNVELTN